MKKLILPTAAILAATLVSGMLLPFRRCATTTLEAPAATVKVNRGRHHRAHHRHYYTHCCGYYSLYTYATPCDGMAAVAGPMKAAAAFLAVVLAGKPMFWGGAIPPL